MRLGVRVDGRRLAARQGAPRLTLTTRKLGHPRLYALTYGCRLFRPFGTGLRDPAAVRSDVRVEASRGQSGPLEASRGQPALRWLRTVLVASATELLASTLTLFAVECLESLLLLAGTGAPLASLQLEDHCLSRHAKSMHEDKLTKRRATALARIFDHPHTLCISCLTAGLCCEKRRRPSTPPTRRETQQRPWRHHDAERRERQGDTQRARARDHQNSLSCARHGSVGREAREPHLW